MPEQMPAENAVHLWPVQLDESARDFSTLLELLSPDEQERAQRFRLEQDRVQFVETRARLRQCISHYLGIPAKEVGFTYSTHGKPAIAFPACDLQFSVAHSHQRAVLAFATSRPVGVDIERLREMPDADQIVTRNFAPEEVRAYLALEPALRPRAFFRAWTRKEAFLKALGLGLHYPLHSFAVSLDEGPARLIHVNGEVNGAGDWTLADVLPDADYLTALVVAGSRTAISVREFNE